MPAGKQGSVRVKVQVKASALKKKGGPGRIENKATVKVGNDPATDTNIVKNPVVEEPPEKPTPTPTPFHRPNTGDTTPVGLWLALLLSGLVALGVAVRVHRRRRGRA